MYLYILFEGLLMKKSIVILLAAIIVLSVSSALAAQNNTFGYVRLPSESVVGINQYEGNTYALKKYNDKKIYVRHYLHEGPYNGVFNNYFQAARTFRNAQQKYGGNWMAPDTANFVQSNSITNNRLWYVYGRSNTKYNQNYIKISGYSNVQ